MSTAQCRPGDINGFPLVIGQSLFTAWPGTELSDVEAKLKQVTVPSEYSVNWAPPAKNVNITINSSNVLQVEGLDIFANGTTMSYGDASYMCEPTLSIIQNNHKFFCNDSSALYCAILSFRIMNKHTNPSSPDIILFCRPLSYDVTNTSTPQMWRDIDTACLSNTKKATTTVDLSTVYGYNSSSLLPLITYQTCIPTKVITPGPTPTSFTGSIRVRVNVIIPPLYINVTAPLMATSIQKYTLLANATYLFSNTSAFAVLQVKDGNTTTSDGFPVQQSHNNLLLNLPSASTLSSFTELINVIEIQVDSSQVGLSLADLSTAKISAAKSGKKAYKCYTVDPTKDIVDGQIMVDPTTGASLTNMPEINNPGTDSTLTVREPTGILPGDIENIISIIATVVTSIGLLGYLFFIFFKWRELFSEHNLTGVTYEELLFHIIFFGFVLTILVFFCIFFNNKPTSAQGNQSIQNISSGSRGSGDTYGLSKQRIIYLVNMSNGIVNDTQFYSMVEALNTLLIGFCDDWSLTNYVVKPSTDQNLQPSSQYYIVYITADRRYVIPGAYGFHLFTVNSTGSAPYGYVSADVIMNYRKANGVLTSDKQSDPQSTSISETVAHEILEIIINPVINKYYDKEPWMTPVLSNFMFAEVADAVNKTSFLITTSNGTKVQMSNYLLPAWFDKYSSGPYDHLALITEPFSEYEGEDSYSAQQSK